MSYYVYILKSLLDGAYYKGSTEDYLKRLKEHNAELSEYTSQKIPWILIYVEEHSDKRFALKPGVYIFFIIQVFFNLAKHGKLVTVIFHLIEIPAIW